MQEFLKSPHFDPVLRLPDVEKYIGLRKTAIYDLISRNEFPKPISLGARARGWLLSDLNSWKQVQIEASCGLSEAALQEGIDSCRGEKL